MPYIAKTQRLKVDAAIENLVGAMASVTMPIEVGVLNYAITRLCHMAAVNQHHPKGPIEDLRYARINAIMGVLSCVQSEFYRRMAAPYEDLKAEENGDVMPSIGV